MNRFCESFAVGLVVLGLPWVAGAQGQQVRPGTSVGLELSAAGGYDDGFARDNGGSTFYEFSPRFDLRTIGRKTLLNLFYRPTIRRVTEFSFQDRWDHQLGLKIQRSLSPRWNLSLQQSAVYATNPFFHTLGDPSGETTFGDLVVAPEHGGLGLDLRTLRSESSLTLAHQLGPRTELSFGADYYLEDPADDRLMHRNILNYRAGYRRQLSRRNAFGVFVSRQRFQSATTHARVLTDSVFLRYEREFRPGTRLWVYAGPQFSKLTLSQVTLDLFFFRITVHETAHESITGPAYGAALLHRIDDHTWINLDYTQRVADGGVFTGTSRQKSFHSGVRRQLGRRVDLSVETTYTDNKAFGGLGPDFILRSAVATTGLRIRVTRRSGFNLRHSYAYYNEVPAELTHLSSRNQVTLGLYYRLGQIYE